MKEWRIIFKEGWDRNCLSLRRYYRGVFIKAAQIILFIQLIILWVLLHSGSTVLLSEARLGPYKNINQNHFAICKIFAL